MLAYRGAMFGGLYLGVYGMFFIKKSLHAQWKLFEQEITYH